MSHIENEMENDRYIMLSGCQCHTLNQFKMLEMSLQKFWHKMQMNHKKKLCSSQWMIKMYFFKPKKQHNELNHDASYNMKGTDKKQT